MSFNTVVLFFFVKLDVAEFVVCMFRVVIISSLLTVSLVRMKCSSLSLLISFSLKYILSDIRIVTHACFLIPFYWSPFWPFFFFTIRQCLSLKLRSISFRQQKDGFYFLTHSVNLYLLIGELRPLILLKCVC